MVENNAITANLGDGTNVTAGKNALVESYFSDFTVDVAGNVAVSGKSNAIGASMLTIVKNNTVSTTLGTGVITANATDAATRAKSGDSVTGVYVGANAKENQYVAAAGVAASGKGNAINGEIVTLVNNNAVLTDASKAALSASQSGTVYDAKDLYIIERVGGSVNYIPISGDDVEQLIGGNTPVYKKRSEGSYVRITNLVRVSKVKTSDQS